MAAKILVADDNEANRALLEELLGAEGFQIIAASDGISALREFEANGPDLVLLDIMMPQLNGFDVCRRLKSNPRTCLVPVILVTALSAKADRVYGIQAGADDFLTRPVDRSELLARVYSLLKLKAHTDELERAESVVFALARTIEARDRYTEGHCERLAEHSVQLGKRLGLAEEELKALKTGGIVHDIGKIAVPDAILLKPARLTEEEWNKMREHPVVGERICAPLKSFRLVLPIIRHHHEKLDGTGYPDGLKGTKIPMTARTMQIIDVYDALTTQRPYKRAFLASEALQIMEDEVKKGWWDPDIFRVFKHLQDQSSQSRAHSAASGH
jgi:putative two-component system response regulator